MNGDRLADKVRVLVVHNAYRQYGGEDAVVAAERDLLTSHGHEVLTYTRHNDEIGGLSVLPLAAGSVWSQRTTNDLRAMFAASRPDVIHVHNTVSLISPSVYWVAAEAGIPVVQTLHNFRLMCPQAMFLRDGKVCEDCLGNVPWRGAVRRCYRGSLAQSTVLAAGITVHRALGTWRHKISRYIALNRFCRDKFIEGGLPAERIMIKPNFVDVAAPPDVPREGFLFVGRLSRDKGIDVLAQALCGAPDLSIAIAGTGPEEHLVPPGAQVRRLGALAGGQVIEAMSRATALVMPSVWYENYPRVLVEAYACGLPVIASRIGAFEELVDDGVTGLLFEVGDPADLAAKLRWAATHPEAMREMGRAARARYEATMTALANYRMLMDIYASAIADKIRIS